MGGRDGHRRRATARRTRPRPGRDRDRPRARAARRATRGGPGDRRATASEARRRQRLGPVPGCGQASRRPEPVGFLCLRRPHASLRRDRGEHPAARERHQSAERRPGQAAGHSSGGPELARARQPHRLSRAAAALAHGTGAGQQLEPRGVESEGQDRLGTGNLSRPTQPSASPRRQQCGRRGGIVGVLQSVSDRRRAGRRERDLGGQHIERPRAAETDRPRPARACHRSARREERRDDQRYSRERFQT